MPSTPLTPIYCTGVVTFTRADDPHHREVVRVGDVVTIKIVDEGTKLTCDTKLKVAGIFVYCEIKGEKEHHDRFTYDPAKILLLGYGHRYVLPTHYEPFELEDIISVDKTQLSPIDHDVAIVLCKWPFKFM